jgi:hypothetical protein
MKRAIACTILALSSGCGGGGEIEPHVDAGLPPTCEDQPPLELGRCEVPATGAPCAGVLDEEQTFVPMTDGDDLTMVRGPQGSLMLVFAARTTGIDPGDPSDPASPANPTIDLRLFDEASEEVARFRARMPFEDEGEVQSAVGLYVVVDEVADRLDGATLYLFGTVTDAAGAARCGTLRLVARRT